MDLSIVKLLEEDDEVDSKHSEYDLKVFQDALIRDIEERPQPRYMKLQKMSSQQALGVEQPVDPVNHGLTLARVCDLLRILVDHHQPDKVIQMRCLTLYYKVKRKELSIQEFMQQLKDVVGDRITRSLISQLHQSKQGNMGIKVPGRPNHDKVSKSAEIIAQQSDPCEVHINQLPSTNSGTLSSSATAQGLNKHPEIHMQLPSSSFHMDTNFGSLNPYPGTNVTSPGLSSRAKLPHFQHMENNQNAGPASVGGPTKSTVNMTTVNGPSRVQDGPIYDFQKNSSLPLYSAPWQGSVTKDHTVGPSSSVIHVEHKLNDQSFEQAQKPRSLVQHGVTNVPLKQNNAILISSYDDLEKQSSKMVLSTSTTFASSVSPSMTTQLDSSTMVNLPAPSKTIPKIADVTVTPKMPSVGQKKPLEALGSSLPPSRKRQKLCETSSDESIEKFNDVTAVSGINLREEEKRLLGSGPKNNGGVSKACRRIVHEEEERTILQKILLKRKLTEIMAKSGLKHIDHDVERCLSLCVEERMRGLLSNIIRISKQRTDAEKCRNRTFITSDIRKEINEMNQKVKEEWEKKRAGEDKNEENETEKEDQRSKEPKANKKDEDKKRAKAANVAVHAAVGGDDRFSKWKLMAEAHQRSSPGPGRNSKKLSGEIGGTQFGKNQGLPKLVQSISVKDVIAVVEKEPQMSRSTLLYCLYNRICSDV
ncbi:transcription initiation factor TFIID subunit 4 isoform X1 [Arabidopsis lyrata subsp. lyrata]|uniref:transcription initiation factor TFIID subunit 4 isoform X1 n=1 Tax=Arabidopsis lyrata subsp. lyrata TaxID=81972 RepID=UPI000A29CC86|nr:transcription initiation factor TFIID subunit 4 isoform X1 [Arabidopsis lyrata subsp. lyrata]|eukprot:XP_020868007.1 transcription initiation factor TFIID subunit 4 isoform X1 [Arabidopsis lyrata subsp. lyrata]